MKRLRLYPFLAFFIAACGGQSCSCLKPIKGGFPTDGRRHENAYQIRVTQGALDYLSANGKALVSSLLGTMGSAVTVPASCGGNGNEICCLNGAPQTCKIDLGIQSFSLTPTPPSTLAAVLTTQLKSEMPIPVTIKEGLTLHCYLKIDTTMSTTAHKDIDIAPTINFSVDTTTDLTSITVDTKINNLDASMLSLTGQSILDDISCGAADLFKGLFLSTLQTQLQDQISKTANDAFCAKCMTQADCDSFADSCTGGQCMRMGKCLQEVGAAGKIDIGSLLSSLSPGTQAGMDTLAVLGGYADVTPMPSSGISLGMLGGAQGDPHSTCVPMRPAPSVPMVMPWMEHDAEVEPVTQKPFHVGIGVHQSQLNTLAWGAFDGGALCLDIGTPTVAMLDSATLGVLIQSLPDLTHDEDGPVFLVMRPQQEPNITIGAGTFNVDMNGKKTIKDPLLNVTIPKFGIDFYVWIDGRYVRVMTLTGDLTIPVGLDVDGMGQIVPLLGDLNKALSNVTVTNSELLSDDPTKLAKSFPMLLGLAAGQLGNVLKPIALPSVMGLNLSIVAIEPADNMSYLSIFANIAVAQMAAAPVHTEAQVARVVTPPTAGFSVESGLDPAQQPQVVLDLGGTRADGSSDGLEWSVSFDGFTWSPYSTARQLSVTDPTLWLQGRHALQVRARVIGEPPTTDPFPVHLEFLIDTIAPVGTADIAGGELVLSATDHVSPKTALEYSVDFGSGWTDWSHTDRLQIPVGHDPLGARVRDEAGNVGSLEFHGRTTTPSTGGCGCTVGGAARNDRLGLLAIGALGLLLLACRRRGAALIALLFASALGVSACNHDVSNGPSLQKGDLEDPMDEIGRYSDSVALAGTIHVSAFDDTTGDLAYAEIDETKLDAPIVWQWVDGVPTDSPADNSSGYRKGISDVGDIVGLYTSIALGSDGNPRIAYYDETNNQLKLAIGSQRVFTTSVVEKLPAGRGGMYASLSLDAHDVPSIAYFTTAIPDNAAGFQSQLKIATAKVANPGGAADWTTAVVDSTPVPCAGLCATGHACIQTDPMDKTKKSTCMPVDAAPCPTACATGQACIGAKCVAALVAPKAPDLDEGIGLFAQLRRLKSGSRIIVYYDHEQGDLKLAAESAGSFTTSFIDGKDPATDVGQYCSAFVAPDDTIHVAYEDAIGDRVLYKTVKGTAAEMAPEVVDDGNRMDGKHPVGADASIWTDGTTVRVVYQDQSTADLVQALRQNGKWTAANVKSGSPGYGFYPKIAADGSKLFVTQFVYDRNGPNGAIPLGNLQAAVLP
jgi:hypothetical protein